MQRIHAQGVRHAREISPMIETSSMQASGRERHQSQTGGDKTTDRCGGLLPQHPNHRPLWRTAVAGCSLTTLTTDRCGGLLPHQPKHRPLWRTAVVGLTLNILTITAKKPPSPPFCPPDRLDASVHTRRVRSHPAPEEAARLVRHQRQLVHPAHVLRQLPLCDRATLSKVGHSHLRTDVPECQLPDITRSTVSRTYMASVLYPPPPHTQPCYAARRRACAARPPPACCGGGSTAYPRSQPDLHVHALPLMTLKPGLARGRLACPSAAHDTMVRSLDPGMTCVVGIQVCNGDV
eukprot:359900-Chlamydomonas_euryale.AAC.2